MNTYLYFTVFTNDFEHKMRLLHDYHWHVNEFYCRTHYDFITYIIILLLFIFMYVEM